MSHKARNLNYKKLGFKALNNRNFKIARVYFSLAYSQESQKELLFLIELCELSKIDMNEALLLLEFYEIKRKEASIETFFDILNSVFAKVLNVQNIEDAELDQEIQDSITYEEFQNLVRVNGNFRKVFEGVMFCSKIVISNKNEMLQFLNDLIEADFIDIGLNYIENSAVIYTGNKNFENIAKKIKNENTNRK